jgi:hypothetical protein
MARAVAANVWFVANHVGETSARISGRGGECATAPMFARATSRRGRDVLIGAIALVWIGALWSAGAWMTGNVARALHEARRPETSSVLVPAEGTDQGSRALSVLEP